MFGILSKHLLDHGQIDLVAIRYQVDRTSKPLAQIFQELEVGIRRPIPYFVGQHQLGVGIYGRPRPHIAAPCGAIGAWLTVFCLA